MSAINYDPLSLVAFFPRSIKAHEISCDTHTQDIYRSIVHRKLAVTSMGQAKSTPHWLTNKDSKTETHVKYYFYNLTNPADFLQGALPTYNLVGEHSIEDICD